MNSIPNSIKTSLVTHLYHQLKELQCSQLETTIQEIAISSAGEKWLFIRDCQFTGLSTTLSCDDPEKEDFLQAKTAE